MTKGLSFCLSVPRNEQMAKKHGKSTVRKKRSAKEPIARIERPLTLIAQVEQLYAARSMTECLDPIEAN